MQNNSKRTVLFLQGPLSPLYRMIGRQLKVQGVGVYRINLCLGDLWHWWGKEAYSYKGDLNAWARYVGSFLDAYRITDLVLHSDQREYHRIAIQEAQKRDIFVVVTEMGIIRPGYMTIQAGGLTCNSWIPDDAKSLYKRTSQTPPIRIHSDFPSQFYLVALPDIFYNGLNIFGKVLFPNYRRHTLYHPFLEYSLWAWRFLKAPLRKLSMRKTLGQLRENDHSVFLFPLQLEGDLSIRRYSQYADQLEAVQEVIKSFKNNATSNQALIFKSHPLDCGYINWEKVVRRISTEFGVQNRVAFIDDGNLENILELCAGVVTINSTAGLDALRANVPVKCLSPAIYDVEGLTFDGPLDRFWRSGMLPNNELLVSFLRVLMEETQVKGTIHNRLGVSVAAINMAHKIVQRSFKFTPKPGQVPPRLEKARKMGVLV
ncbi:capsule biosynthesis protein [Flexibacterium corallicola]|uniref:capsule biosynthesis protein n=1 Tax=Flexibacterium corallicola TaxID=3037259 RepID=UPI00286F7540|nr:capsular biosynthesis protein [Pseudovibrio sp. M1P-2-3]